ncbi:hypothetical protein Q7P37_006093 [Cladosporium fusiforme]
MSTPIPEEADIVIIGGGTAGCVLANRLSSDLSVKVVVLEAGESHSEDARVYTPARAGELLGDEQLDWQYRSGTESGMHHHRRASYDSSVFACPGKPGRQMTHPRGKAVGGSSLINSFALINPSAAEFDAWAELGNKGWDWANFKDYLKKFQTVTAPDPNVTEELSLVHNFASNIGSGPVQATFPLAATALQKAWLDAFRSLGLGTVNDPLEGRAMGGGITPCHIGLKNRERISAEVAYLRPVKSRENLNIVTGAMVQRILFERRDGDGKAIGTGVIYEKGGEARHVKVRREIILVAGAFGTPQLLELSGIGDSRILKEQIIDFVYDNPSVGENLQVHIRAGITFEATEATEAAVGNYPSMSREEAERLYIKDRSGPWAKMAAYMFASRFDCENENLTTFERKHASFVKNTIFSSAEASATAYLTRKPIAPLPGPELEAGKCITFCAMLSHPLSRGSVHIQSSDPNEKPSVAFNYYKNPFDVEVHARHLLALQSLVEAPAFSCMMRTNGKRYPPVLDMHSAKNFLRDTATTNYHLCGSCAMLPEDLGGVVDSRLKVYGSANVRVVDASTFPIIPRGNIISVVYAVAEKGADMIWEDLGLGGTWC